MSVLSVLKELDDLESEESSSSDSLLELSVRSPSMAEESVATQPLPVHS